MTTEQLILAAIRRIIRAVDLHSRHLLTEHGLTGPQLSALAEINSTGRLTPLELARRMHVGQPTVTGILDRLERHELITRTRSGEDKRSFQLTLTEGGRRVLAQAPPLLQQRFTQKLGKLQDWEQTQILSTLQRIAAMMEAEEFEASPHLVSGADSL